MKIYYGFIKNSQTQKVMGPRTCVGVAGTMVKGKPRYLALCVSTTEKKFKELLENMVDEKDELIAKEAPIKPLLTEVRTYLKGDLKKFTHKPFFVKGTQFQKAVWTALQSVPYGKIETYGGIARKLGKPRAARAVGMANNANPISLVVPCHRIVGSSGGLVGYGGGGVSVKKKLLQLEGSKD